MPSKALETLIRGLPMKDTWRQQPTRPCYTHYTSTSASRLDRFYATNDFHNRKIATEIVATAFTDHCAVTLRLNLDIPIFRRGRGMWKLTTSLLYAKGSKQKLETRWAGWTRQKRYFSELTMWWFRLTKKNIKHFYIHEGSIQRRKIKEKENFYYACIYDVLLDSRPQEKKRTSIASGPK